LGKDKKIKNQGKIIVISGPSGAGKTTLIRKVKKEIPTLAFSVSATTRPIRKGEKEGVDYFYISEEIFKSLIKSDSFIEWAKVHGNLYGTMKHHVEELIKKKKDVVLDIDEQGAHQIREKNIPAILIYILPPSIKELEKRLEKRKSELKKEMKKRLKNAKEQILSRGFYDYVVINDDINKAVEELKDIINEYIKDKEEIG
jgi:guanylate kinase